MASNLLSGIANPTIANPRQSFLAGKERGEQRLSKELAGKVLSETLVSKMGRDALKSLQELNPEAALSLRKTLRTESQADQELVIGATKGAAAIINGGGTPDDVANWMSSQAVLLQQAGSPVAQQFVDAAQAIKNPETQEETLKNLLISNEAFSSAGDKKFSAATKVLENGSSIQTDTKGNVIVKNPEGKIVRGAEAAKVTKAAREEGIRVQTERAGGRTGASEAEKRASSLIERGEAAAESTATIRRALTLMDVVKTGGINAVSLAVKQKLGIEGANEGELSNSLGKSVLSQLRETFGAAFTENEGQRLERIEAGFGKSPATNRRLLGQALKLAERTARRAIKAAKSRKQNDVAADIEDLLTFSLDLEDQEEAAGQPNVGRFQIEVIQ